MIEITYVDKIFWPELKITKGDLAKYYETVSKRMLPYILHRPHALLRQPDGYKGKGFFQKNIEKPPEGITTVSIHSESTDEDVNYLVCTGLDSLLYMVQLGCIEINPWHSKVKSLDHPDWIIMDLDPEEIDFKAVMQVALTIKQLCAEWHIPSYPKTSGKRGLHVYIPTGGKYTYKQVKQFSELLAIQINNREPEITSLERLPAKRKHKVYIDYLRNAEGQTVSAPYSVRPTPEASVSTPLSWSEVAPRLKPTDFTIKNIANRLKKTDPWQDMLKDRFDLAKALSNLA